MQGDKHTQNGEKLETIITNNLRKFILTEKIDE